jgi:hypothetical protein
VATLSAIFNVFVRWAIVSCALDIFGLERRAIGAPHADVEAPKSSLAACHVNPLEETTYNCGFKHRSTGRSIVLNQS